MMVFLDFEASSLGRRSYPIEIGWVFETGASESHLIRPAEGWTDWDPEAEALHGLSRAVLTHRGEDHRAVAARMLSALAGHDLFASAPSWDGKWLSVLFRAADLPRRALRLSATETALRRTIRSTLKGAQPVDATTLEARTLEILKRARRETPPPQARHRALPDAEAERALWRRGLILAEAARDGDAADPAAPLGAGRG